MTSDAQAKPVIALMGEFSAGKSTLSNLLLGEERSPVKVTATQLPPVWFSHGPDRMIAVGRDGSENDLRPEDLGAVELTETSHIRVWLESEILEVMDLIDMPGNSDPNMAPEVWQSMMRHVDGAVWCSHATQAWRQSEAAAWAEMPEALRDRSILLLTRFDKLLSERDRAKVLRRVRAEAGELFRGVFPIALTDALTASDDRSLWEESGAEAFSQALLDIGFDCDADSRSCGTPLSLVTMRPEREHATEALVLGPAERADPEPGLVVPIPRRVVPVRPQRPTGRSPSDRPTRPHPD